MSQQVITIENLSNPMPVSGTVNAITSVPTTLSSFVFSVANVPGVAAANTFVSIYNPIGSGKTISIAGLFISCSATGAQSVTDPLRGYRITAAPTGGTVQAASAINKLVTASAATIADVRIGNPTVVLGTPFFNSPAFTTGSSGTGQVHQVTTTPGVPFTLVPGEGMALNTATGATNERWNISISWGEM
jgi:hypothetical protein